MLCIFFQGCDYTLKLVDKPTINIDRSVIGLWQSTNHNDQVENLLILPLGNKEYMVSFPAGSDDAMFARASLWRQKEMVLVQLNWFGTAKGKLPENKRTFQYASYKLNDDSLTVRLLNPEIISTKLASTEEFVQNIEKNKDNVKLFRNKMVFKKIELKP